MTAGQIARLVQVAPRTVCKWIDSGKLAGYRIPVASGRPSYLGDRRVMRADLVAFLERSQFPAEVIERIRAVGQVGVAIGLPPSWEAKLREEWPDVILADGIFAAGVLVAETRPAAVVVDLSVGRIEAKSIASTVKKTMFDRRCVGITGDDDRDTADLKSAGFDAVFAPPIDWKAVANAMRGK